MSIEIDSVLSGIIVLLLIIVVWKWYGDLSPCGQSSMTLSCGCIRGNCRCRDISRVSKPKHTSCNNTVHENFKISHDKNQVTGSGYHPIPASKMTQNYQEVTKEMGLESGVGDSHKKWCDALSYNGLTTGASSCTTLEETGRSYGTADFVGLTSRKWCKARQMATPAPDSRVTPSHDVEEWCDIDMDELV
jgi:hypothetical protein